MRSSLSLRIPAALLPTTASPESGLGGELSAELKGLNLQPALHELDRGFSDTAAAAAAPPPTTTAPAGGKPALGRSTTGLASAPRQGGAAPAGHASLQFQTGQRGSSSAGGGGGAVSASPEVQRVGSRRQTSQPGGKPAAGASPSPARTPSSAPSARPSDESSASRVPAVQAAPAPAAPATLPPSPPSSCGSSPRSSSLGAHSRSSSLGYTSADNGTVVGGQAARGPASLSSSATASTATLPRPGHTAAPQRPQQPHDSQPQQPLQQQQPQGSPKATARGSSGTGRGARSSSPASTRPSSRASSRLGGASCSAGPAAGRQGRPGSAGTSTSGSRPISVAPATRPGSPSKQPGWTCPAKPTLEARVSRQMAKDPADWTVSEVCDWLEWIGLGQYRRRFVHNAVSGALLLKLSNEQLKVEVGIGPLGHREGLLTAINQLEEHWQQHGQHAAAAGGAGGGEAWQDGGSPCSSPGGSRPGSPGPPGAGMDIGMQKAYAQRAKLLRELEKAEGRQALRTRAAEKALNVVGQASDEVRRLQASICELDRQLGWHAATQQLFDPTDVHGAVAWQPAGKQRAPPRRPRSGSPGSPAAEGRGRSASPGAVGGSPGSPMSRVSRRIMEAQSASGAGGSFLERLSRDVASRQAKAAQAARKAGRYMGTADEQLAEKEQEARDVAFIRETIEAKHSGLAEMLASGDPAQLAEACDDVVQSFQSELALSEEAVAAVRRLGTPGKKAAKLAGAIRSQQFMQRLQQDLSTRDARLQELQKKFFLLEQGNSLEQQERADLASAQAHFAALGWPPSDLEVAAEDASGPCDAPLAALLKRVVAVQEARQRGKPAPDWEQPEWRRDGLAELQQERNAELQAALDEQKAAEAAAAEAAGARRNYRQALTRPKELPQPGDRLGETVELLAGCRPAEVALLEGLGGYRKLVMCWRAVRAQQFIDFTRRDLEARKKKALELEAQVYPDNTKVLPKKAYEEFFDRLMADTQRRAQHKDELAEKAKADALAKLMKSAPAPPGHRKAEAGAPRPPSRGPA